MHQLGLVQPLGAAAAWQAHIFPQDSLFSEKMILYSTRYSSYPPGSVLARAYQVADEVADGAAHECAVPLAIAGSGNHAQRGSAGATFVSAAQAWTLPLASLGSGSHAWRM